MGQRRKDTSLHPVYSTPRHATPYTSGERCESWANNLASHIINHGDSKPRAVGRFLMKMPGFRMVNPPPSPPPGQARCTTHSVITLSPPPCTATRRHNSPLPCRPLKKRRVLSLQAGREDRRGKWSGKELKRVAAAVSWVTAENFERARRGKCTALSTSQRKNLLDTQICVVNSKRILKSKIRANQSQWNGCSVAYKLVVRCTVSPIRM